MKHLWEAKHLWNLYLQLFTGSLSLQFPVRLKFVLSLSSSDSAASQPSGELARFSSLSWMQTCTPLCFVYSTARVTLALSLTSLTFVCSDDSVASLSCWFTLSWCKVSLSLRLTITPLVTWCLPLLYSLSWSPGPTCISYSPSSQCLLSLLCCFWSASSSFYLVPPLSLLCLCLSCPMGRIAINLYTGLRARLACSQFFCSQSFTMSACGRPALYVE